METGKENADVSPRLSAITVPSANSRSSAVRMRSCGTSRSFSASDVSSFRKGNHHVQNPVDGYPKSYARDDIPKLDRYPGGQTLPMPSTLPEPYGRDNSDISRQI
jgi:hypothetical protein